MSAPIKLMTEVKRIEADLQWIDGKYVLPDAAFARWQRDLGRVPAVFKAALKTQLVALAARIMRTTENAPEVQPALRRIAELAVGVMSDEARPDDGFARSAPTGAGARTVGGLVPTTAARTAPRLGAKPPPGTMTVAAMFGPARRVA